jgi:hypothetical protein
MSTQTLLILGAVFLLGRRSMRGRAATAPPPGWGAPAPRSAAGSAKLAMVVIIIVAALLTGITLQGAGAAGTRSGSSGSGPTLAGIFGALANPQLPKILGSAPGPKVTASSKALLKSKRLELTPRARADLKAGRVDRDLVKILAQLLRHHRLSISVFKSGHSKYVAGTNRVSRHYGGRGVDIWKVDGGLVRAGHRPSLDVARRLTRMRTAEVGSPFGRLGRGFFTDRAHGDHIHIGVR